MSDKRFTTDYSDFLKNAKTFIKMDNKRLTYEEIVDLLNEQQDTINKLREILEEAEDMIEVRLAEHYIQEYENIKHHIIGDNDE